MHDDLTETGKRALLCRPGPVSEGIHPGTAARAALFWFWFAYCVASSFSPCVSLLVDSKQVGCDPRVQELRALPEHTGLPQPWLSLFPL